MQWEAIYEMQVLRTHHSYHIQPRDSILDSYRTQASTAPMLAASHSSSPTASNGFHTSKSRPAALIRPNEKRSTFTRPPQAQIDSQTAPQERTYTTPVRDRIWFSPGAFTFLLETRVRARNALHDTPASTRCHGGRPPCGFQRSMLRAPCHTAH